MKVFRKNIKDIHNATLRYGKDMYEKFTRISPTEFERMYKNDKDWVCTGCGEYLDKSNEEAHRGCLFSVLSEEYVAQYIADMLADDEDNVLQINEGHDDECYIAFG